MKNTNLFNCNGATFDGSNYLYMDEIPNFTIKKPFTIECSFSASELQTNKQYILFERIDQNREVMGLYISGNRPCLYYEGYTILFAKDYILKTDELTTLAGVFDGNSLKLYVNGLNIEMDYVEKDTEKKKLEKNDFKYCEDQGANPFYKIGYNYRGLITRLQVYQEEISGGVIRKRTILPEKFSTNASLFMDFSSNTYKDISVNKMPISSFGETVAENFVYCTKVEKDGYYVLPTHIDVKKEYFACIQICPLPFLYSKTAYLSAYNSNDSSIFYEILTERRENGKYTITLNYNKKTIKTNKELDIQVWHDVALAWDSKGICLFVDGDKIAEDTLTECPEVNGLSTVIGSTIDFESVNDNFYGYLGYFAEYNIAFNWSIVNELINNPPYIYDEGLKTLVFFNQKNVHELLNNKHLCKYGHTEFGLYPNLNPPAPPTKFNIRVPNEKNPDWDKLTEIEQETYRTMFTMIKGIYKYTLELPVSEEVKVENIYHIMRKYHNNLFDLLLSDTLSEPKDAEEASKYVKEILTSAGDFWPLMSGELIPGGGFIISTIYIVMAIIAIVIMTTATMEYANIQYKKKKNLWLLLLGTSAFACICYAILSQQSIIQNQEKPLGVMEGAKVECGDPTIGSIHFKNDRKMVREEQNLFVAVVVPKMLSNKKILVKVKVQNLSSKVIKGSFHIFSTLLGGNTEGNITSIQPKKTVSVEFITKIAKDFIPGRYHYARDFYTVTFTNTDGISQVPNITGTVEIFALANVPVKPWSTGIGIYDDLKKYVSLAFFNVFKPKIGIESTIELKSLASSLATINTFKATFENSFATHLSEAALSLNVKVFTNYVYENSSKIELSSLDVAAIVQTFYFANGFYGGIVKLSNDHAFKTYNTKDRWDNIHMSKNLTSYYLVSYFGEIPNPGGVLYTTLVCDPLMQVKSGIDPFNNDMNVKSFDLGALSLSDSPTVEYSVPLTENIFRERYVVKGELCKWDAVFYNVYTLIL